MMLSQKIQNLKLRKRFLKEFLPTLTVVFSPISLPASPSDSLHFFIIADYQHVQNPFVNAFFTPVVSCYEKPLGFLNIFGDFAVNPAFKKKSISVPEEWRFLLFLNAVSLHSLDRNLNHKSSAILASSMAGSIKRNFQEETFSKWSDPATFVGCNFTTPYNCFVSPFSTFFHKMYLNSHFSRLSSQLAIVHSLSESQLNL